MIKFFEWRFWADFLSWWKLLYVISHGWYTLGYEDQSSSSGNRVFYSKAVFFKTYPRTGAGNYNDSQYLDIFY